MASTNHQTENPYMKSVFRKILLPAFVASGALFLTANSEARAELAYRHLATTSGIIVDGGRVVMSPGYLFQPAGLVTQRIVAQLSGPYCRAYVAGASFMTPMQRTYAQRMIRYADGSFDVTGGIVSWISFEITQPLLTRTSVCDLHLYALLDNTATPAPVPVTPVPNPYDPGNQDPTREELLGVINYNGGFGHDLPVVQSNRNGLDGFVVGIRVAVPEFCQQTEVLGAGTVSEGKFDPATPASNIRGAFVVNGGQGLRVSEILVTVNGPFNSQCAIPVYTKIRD